LTNATVVDDAIRFVSLRQAEKLKSSAHNCNKREIDQREEKLERGIKEINHTTNHVF
jgi:hypothetical protein